MNSRVLTIILFIFLTGGLTAQAQEVVTSEEAVLAVDSAFINPSDSLTLSPSDSLAVADSVPRGNALDAPVTYQATDSIVMTGGNFTYMYGEAVVKYQNIELESEYVEMNMDSSIVFATFGLDSVGQEFGYPYFKEGEQGYESKTMRYNFRTKKGYIANVVTQQGEGYVVANRTKKMDDNVLNMREGRYTTCDNHEHPHFYIQMTKAKVRPHKDIVTGPVYLVIEDVPLPLALPFAFFPFSSSYQSGILMPTFGDESNRGYNLRNGGYYFALSDYMDLAVTGDIYSKGSWALNAESKYRKRYKYSGAFRASYQVTITGDKGLPDYVKQKDIKLQWNHTQDAKANPYRTFSASVNFATSSYDRNNMNSQYNMESTNSNRGSTVNITQRFPNSPFSISGTMSVNQTLRDSSVALTLPDISVTMSRIYPFKRKNAIGKERWYEKISMSYTGYLRNSIRTKEDQLLKSSLIKDWQNGMQHSIPISATFNVLRYINIAPTINYRERWYTSRIDREYDPQLQGLAARDTTYGFYRLYDFDASIAASTTIFGMFTPIASLQKLTRIKAIRHRMEPSVSFSARPDFGSSGFGYYENYSYLTSDGIEKTEPYSPFQHHQFGVPTAGKSGSINFALDNNVEMKIISDRDSTGERKVSLIDKLSFGTSYNLAADSFKWSNLNVGLRLKFSKSYTLNLTGVFDVYTYRPVTNSQGDVIGLQRNDKLRIQSGKGIGRLQSTGTSFSYTFSNDTFKKWFGKKDQPEGVETSNPVLDDPTENDMLPDGTEPGAQSDGRLLSQKREVGAYDDDGYMVTQIPWTLSFSYSMRLGYDTQKFDPKKYEYKYRITHSLSFNGSIQPTKNWRLSFNATYDFDTRKISYMTCNVTRDLHCFQMSASFVPFGPYTSYAFSIAVSSSLLQDLKYNKSSSYRDAQQWY